jgi:site-specific DNA-methyltransferase (adenine-specific)
MNDLVVANLDKARQLLLGCRDAADAKLVADLARAAEVYAKRQKLAQEVAQHAHEIQIDAQTLMGRFLRNAPKATGGDAQRTRFRKGTESPPTLAQAGIGKKESATAQTLAVIEATQPDLHAQVRAGKVTIPQARRHVAREEKKAALDAKARAAEASTNGKPRSWEIITGDCLEILKTIPRGSVRQVVTDPQYNIGFDFGRGPEADRLPEDEYLRPFVDLIAECYDVLTDDGSLWLTINHENAAAIELILRGRGVVLESGEVIQGRVPFHVRSWLTWYESFGVNCSNNFNRCSRRILHCVKDPRRFVFNADAVTRPSDRQTDYQDTRADPGGKVWDDVWGIKPKIPRLVDNASERIPGFPTQLPLALVRPQVGCGSDPGDTVLDLCSGSGTTGHACIELGRQFIGIEKNPEFAETSRQRLIVAEASRNA